MDQVVTRLTMAMQWTAQAASALMGMGIISSRHAEARSARVPAWHIRLQG
jgi:hypothetical protein